ncbi:hypothetical protein [Natrarchaeobius oligotrophus]|uniref:Uncharacterized protein n=1 Tax=Natrarchaeobius chitinivorans TaxID=1679083 RepID=A0A3N6MUX0_NATCH|nr:hypothetical protein [Natrarchaeobius chitinivorans]RQH00102.1 hypothetical protein EA472_12910 [Natrarchaeobius chitinivorans]
MDETRSKYAGTVVSLLEERRVDVALTIAIGAALIGFVAVGSGMVVVAALLVALTALVVGFVPSVDYDGPPPTTLALFAVGVGLVVVLL